MIHEVINYHKDQAMFIAAFIADKIATAKHRISNRNSVDGILDQLGGTAAKLYDHADAMDVKVLDLESQMHALRMERNYAESEAERANRIAARIDALLD